MERKVVSNYTIEAYAVHPLMAAHYPWQAEFRIYKGGKLIKSDRPGAPCNTQREAIAIAFASAEDWIKKEL